MDSREKRESRESWAKEANGEMTAKMDSQESRAKEENQDPPTGISRASLDIQVMTVFPD